MRSTSLPVLPQSPALQLDSARLAELELRQRVIIPIAEIHRPNEATKIEAATKLGVSLRTVGLLIQRYRKSNHDPLSLLSVLPGPPKGSTKLSKEVENIITEAITKVFQKSQKPSLITVYRHIKTACRQRGLKSPSLNTIKKRQQLLSPLHSKRRRHGANAAQTLKPVVGQQMPARS
jgi:putative transposase